jgi:hypothetical protein
MTWKVVPAAGFAGFAGFDSPTNPAAVPAAAFWFIYYRRQGRDG